MKYWLFCFSLLGVDTLQAAEVLSLGYLYSPHYTMEADLDEDEEGNGVEFHHHLNSGSARGFALGVGDSTDADGSSQLVFSFVESTQDDRDSGDQVQSRSVYLSLEVLDFASGSTALKPYFGWHIGAGFVSLDYPGVELDDGGLSMSLGAKLGLALGRSMQWSVGYSVYGWGYPTETIANGGMLFSELRLLLK